MAAKKIYGIKFSIKASGRDFGIFLECLRYSQILRYEGDENDVVTITLWAPNGLVGEIWQTQNIARMASFGIKAEGIAL